MQFGEEIKDEFLLDRSVTFVNHGSYGPCIKKALEQRIKFLYEQESQPDLWFRFNLMKYYEEAVAALADFVGANKENLVLVDNVTTGINAVVKCLKYEPGDQILIHTHTYNAVRNIAVEQDDCKGVGVVTIEIQFPIKSEDDIVVLFKKALKENPNIKLAIIDHITSPSAIIFPIKKIVDLCREHGVLTLIDGAHAPGQLQLNLEELGADFYAANLHKWCYVARGCGFVWASPQFHHQLKPLVTSHGYKSSLTEQFYKPGTKDTSNQLTVPLALKFYKEIGGREAITAYTDELLTYAQKILLEAFGTELLDIPRSMRAPNMAVVRFPYHVDPSADIRLVGDSLTEEIFVTYKVQVAFSAFAGSIWVRCSANVYNTKQDYEKLRDVLVDCLAKRKQ